MMKKLRVYVDTSVIGGKFDNVHALATQAFWDAVEKGDIVVLASDVLDEEVERSPQHIRDFFDELPVSQVERIVSTDESDTLANRYIAANVVNKESLNDCKHVALATIYSDGIVSWNLRDMVKRQKKYNNVNRAQGYPEIKILTPDKFLEVCYDET